MTHARKPWSSQSLRAALVVGLLLLAGLVSGAAGQGAGAPAAPRDGLPAEPRREISPWAAGANRGIPSLHAEESATPPVGYGETPTEGRHPSAVAAERAFVAAFNGGGRRDAPLRDLTRAWAADPSDPRTNLLLGLNHLWVVAEGDRTNARILDHLLLSEVFLARAQALAPDDDRIPSWLDPVRQALAEIEGDEAAVEAHWQSLLAAYERDPAFHSFSVALQAIDEPRGSDLFALGHRALRTAAESGCEDGDPSCENLPRWPHNQEGYLTFWADYELKAGEREKATEVLAMVQTVPEYETWPYKAEVEDRVANLDLYLELYANDDPGDDPPVIIESHGCSSCHEG